MSEPAMQLELPREAALPLLRWSSVRSCPRKAVYEATGAPARERTDREERILYRGKSLGRDYGDWLAAKYGPENVQREVKVQWPIGVGHMDVFLVPTGTAIEVLSSAHAGDAVRRGKLLQLVGYMEHHEPTENGCLVVLDPADFTEERYPVAKDTKVYNELKAEMWRRVELLRRWRNTGDVPARVCEKPNDAYQHFCLHAEHCFTGWEPPPLPQVHEPETVDLVQRFTQVKAREQAAGRDQRAAEKERKELEGQIAALPHFDGAGKWQVGRVELARSFTQRPATINVPDLELAGVDLEPLRQFVKPGAGYFTTRVNETEAAPVETPTVVDYGDEAPF